MTALQQNVFGRDVTMDHAALMRVLQRVGDFARNAQCVIDGELLFAVQFVAQ